MIATFRAETEESTGREHHESRPTPVNVGDAERWLAAVGGGALALCGLARGSVGGLVLAAVGGAALYRSLSGHCPLYAALGINTAGPHPPATAIPAGSGVKIE